jgi:hypothetical protein
MRTVTQKVYSIRELSNESQQRAHESWWERAEYPWWDENQASIDAFLGLFAGEVKYCCYGSTCKSYPFGIQFNLSNEDIGYFMGKRAHAYLQNHIVPYFEKEKVYKKGDKVRSSRIFMQESSCPLTGYYVDDQLWEELSKRIKENEFTNIRELLYGTLATVLRELQEDYDNYFSPENFREECIANEWEFFATGELYIN